MVGKRGMRMYADARMEMVHTLERGERNGATEWPPVMFWQPLPWSISHSGQTDSLSALHGSLRGCTLPIVENIVVTNCSLV